LPRADEALARRRMAGGHTSSRARSLDAVFGRR
jgi:hypothetical protein